MKHATQEAYQLFHEGSLALADVEANGLYVDVDYVQRTRAKLAKEIREAEASIKDDEVYRLWHKTYGSNLNLDSGPQLANIVFDKLGYEPTEFTDKIDPKTGKRRPKTDEEAFQDIDLPFLQRLREIKKKKHSDDILRGISEETVDCLVHPNFNLNLAKSYRSTCDNPNSQNWPIRNPEMGRLIRSTFIPRGPGRQMLEVDLSGAEVRTAACYNHDPVLIDYLLNSPPKDMHRDMAARIFFLKEKEVGKKTTRDISKNQFVFPQFYGSVYFNCAKDMWKSCIRRKFNVEGKEETILERLAKHGIHELGACIPGEDPVRGTFEYHMREVENYFWNEQYVVYTEWKNQTWKEYLRKGYIQTLTGFVIHGVWDRKQILNSPIQGSSFHCLLWCLIQINKWLKKHRMGSLIIGTIHDSIIFDIAEGELEDVLAIVKYTIMKALRKHYSWLIIPMEFEAEAAEPGQSWYNKKEVKVA